LTAAASGCPRERAGTLESMRVYYYTREVIAEADAALGIAYATHPRIMTR
jgi:hypothetical protein